jgi:serine phosphatase RsbU (regulator of sigma subunit)/Tfp pilus assembly protein PilF
MVIYRIIFFLILTIYGFSQNKIHVYRRINHPDTAIIDSVAKASYKLTNLEFYQNIPFIEKHIELAKKIKDTAGWVHLLNSMASHYYSSGDFSKSSSYFNKAYFLASKTGSHKLMFDVSLNFGNLYYYHNNYKKAEEWYRIAEYHLNKTKNKSYLSLNNVYNNLGSTYGAMGRLWESEKYFLKCLHLIKYIPDSLNTAFTYNNIGQTYYHMNKLNLAKFFLFKSMLIKVKMKDSNIVFDGYSSYGLILNKLNMYDSSLYYLHLSRPYLNYKDYFDDVRGYYTGIVENFLHKKMHDSAHYYFNMYNNFITNKFLELSEGLVSGGEENFLKEVKMEADSLRNEITNKNKEIIIQKQKTISYSTVIILLIALIFTGLLYNRFKIIKQQKQIIENQNLLLEEKNKNIEESIRYARHVQSGFLPKENIFSKYFTDYYLIFLPRDIVSGDFYFAYPVNEGLYVGVADCTGHGVPGAMMSMLCHDLLIQCIKDASVNSPEIILNMAKKRISTRMDENHSLRDGMDISLIFIPENRKYIKYAGANRPLWIKRNKELLIFTPDKHSIGYSEMEVNFTLQEIELQKSDILYMFSDGITDQFHHLNGKKITTKKLKEFIISLPDDINVIEEKKQLENYFLDWKGHAEQTDDVCFLSLRI